jgi:hypothetical protein
MPYLVTDGSLDMTEHFAMKLRNVSGATYIYTGDGTTSQLGLSASTSIEALKPLLAALTGKPHLCWDEDVASKLQEIPKKFPDVSVRITASIQGGLLGNSYIQASSHGSLESEHEDKTFGHNPRYSGNQYTATFPEGTKWAVVYKYGAPSLNGHRQPHRILYVAMSAAPADIDEAFAALK